MIVVTEIFKLKISEEKFWRRARIAFRILIGSKWIYGIERVKFNRPTKVIGVEL